MKIILFIFFIISCTDKSGVPEAVITVPQGEIVIRFYHDEAPNHVFNFISLAEDRFYNGTTFHRVESGYLVQGGDIKSKRPPIYDDGTGQMEYTIATEWHHPHLKGSVAMAKKPSSLNPENNSNGSQFYITLDRLPQLDEERYTVFAYVVSGFETLEKMTDLELMHDMNPNSNWKKTTEMTVEIRYIKKDD